MDTLYEKYLGDLLRLVKHKSFHFKFTRILLEAPLKPGLEIFAIHMLQNL